MTPQEVIKNFMAGLAESNSSGKTMLDAAVKASSDFSSIQDVIDKMKADQAAAEKEAVEEILGSTYAGKTISQVGTTILNKKATAYEDVYKKSNMYVGDGYKYSDYKTTVKDVINECKATIFLEKYCGIQLNNKYWYNSGWTSWRGDNGLSGNVDTGAITGSDANISLKAGDVVGEVTLTSAIINALAQKDGNSLSGDTLIVGTGTEKTERSVVPEIGNKYTAKTSKAQNIKTGSNDWIVAATDYNDTITTGGADSISAGAGNDKIIVGADYASILTGAGNDSVEISADVKNVTIDDLNSSDVLTISGTFQIGSAQIEDTMLVVTDKTGTRKIRLGNLENAKNSKVNGTTLANWLSAAGFNINNLKSVSSSNVIENPATEEIPIGSGDGRITIDKDYKPAQIEIPVKETENLPTRSANTTGNVNVNLDNVSISSGDLEIDGATVGEISNEFPNISSFTKNGLTINLLGVTTSTSGDTSNIQTKTLDELTDDQKTIVAGLFKWWAKECIKLNEESYGMGFNSPTTMVKEIGLYFYDSKGSGNTLAAVWNWSSGSKTSKLMLNVNMNYYSGIAENNFDGESSGSNALLDRTLAHEFTHAVMATNLKNFNSLPQFIKEGMAELTHGIDDERGSGIFGLAADSSKLNTALSLTDTGTGTSEAYSGGYMFLRYFARQAALNSLLDGVDTDKPLKTGTADADFIENTLAGATINALGGDDTVKNTGANVIINGGAGNDSIKNSGHWVSIIGGDGDDIILNEVDDDSKKNDDGEIDDDEIFLEDAFLAGGAGNDTIYNNSDGTATINGDSGNDSIKNDANNATIDGGDGNDIIESNGVYVSISGGAGNDFISLNSSAKNNLIKYTKGDGSDSIIGFNETSTLSITSDNFTSVTSGDDIIFTVGSGKISLIGAATLPAVNIKYKNTGEKWEFKGTTATYKIDGKVIATVKGLSKNLAVSDGSIDGIIVENGEIILSKKVVDTANVTLTLTKGYDYKLALDEDFNDSLVTISNKKWTVGSGTAILKGDLSAGYSLSEDGKTITYAKTATKSKELAKVTGLTKTGISAADFSTTENIITLKNSMVATSKIAVTGAGYTLALSEDVSKPELQPEYWTLSGTTATYKQDTAAGFTLAADNKSANYSTLKTATLATVSGLQKNLTVENKNIDGITVADKVITLDKKVLGESNVTVKGDYTLNVPSVYTIPEANQRWRVNGTTATYERFNGAYFTPSTDKKTVKYVKESITATPVTIKGLATGAKVGDDGYIAGIGGGLNYNQNITLSGDELFGNKVEVKLADGYTLNNQLKTPAISKTYWAVKNGTATLKQDVTDGYLLVTNAKTGVNTLTYSKAVTLNVATVSGLNKTLKDTDGALDGLTYDTTNKVITLDKKVLGASNVTVNGDYTLSVAESLTTPAIKDRWQVSGSTATYDSVQGEYFKPSTNKKTLTYNKEKTTKNLITVKGLATGAKVDDNGNVAGITLSDKNITLAGDELFGNKVEVKLADGYTLNNQLKTPAISKTYWTVKNGSATLKQDVTDGYALVTNAKTGVNTLTYAKAKTENVATVSGLNKTLKDTDGALDGLTYDTTNKVITLDKKVLGTSNVTVNGDYTLSVAESLTTPVTKDRWQVSGATATYDSVQGEYFKPSTNNKALTYNKEKTTKNLITVKGLATGAKVDDSGNVAGITLSDKNITLTGDELFGNKVEVKLAEGYTLNNQLKTPAISKTYWAVRNGSATLKQDVTDGYLLVTNAKTGVNTLTYAKAKTENVATVSGLNKTLKDTDGILDGLTYDTTSKVITLDKKVLGTSNVTVNGDYTLSVEESLTTPVTKDRWQVSGATATYDSVQGEYFKPSTNNKALTYNKEKTTKNLITVKGLATGAKVDDSGNVAGITLSDKNITLAGDELFGNKVEVKLADGYTLNNQLKTPAISKTYWAVKNGTATLKQDVTDGYALVTNAKTGVNTLTYSKAVTLNVATVSGLNKTLKDTDGALDGLTYDTTNKIITVDSRVLAASNVSVKGDYTLDFVTTGNYAPPTETKTDNVWTVSGTIATYKNINIGYFTRKNDKTFTYAKEKLIKNLATISGIKKNTSAENFTVNENVINLSKDALVDNPTANTKITLGKNDAYELSLDNDIEKVDYNDAAWIYSNNKATFTSSVKTAGYSISDDNKTITYIPAKDSKGNAVTKTYATLSGVKSNNGISVEGNVISLTESALNAKTVTLDKNNDYTLALGNSSLAPARESDDIWKKSNTTATLTVTMSKGYSPSADGKSLVYSGKSTNKTLATISGINKNADISTFKATADGDTQKIILSNDQLGKKVTVSSEYNLEFASDYGNATIIGSNLSDTIKVAGSDLSVSGGKGDDKITFAGNQNTFLYASGDGNDVIADFTASSDKIKITSGKVSVESAENDVLVKVDKGSIKLTGAAGQTISILDNKNKVTTYATAASSNYWFESENPVEPSQIDSLVETPASNYLPDDLNTDSTNLTKEKNQIVYAAEK